MSPKPTWKGGGGLAESIGISFAGVSRKPPENRSQAQSSAKSEGQEAPVAEAIIVDAIRTARGKRKGALSGLHPVDLLARTLAGSLARAGVAPKDVDDVIMGCVTQVGEQGMNIARGAVLAAGLPIEVPGTTVNRFCGSGLQAVNFAAQAVMAGTMGLTVAGGVEHMTRVPMGSDVAGGEGPASPDLQKQWPDLVPQGLSAEMIAANGATRARSWTSSPPSRRRKPSPPSRRASSRRRSCPSRCPTAGASTATSTRGPAPRRRRSRS